MSYAFTLTTVIPASPRAIYDAWLDSRGHTAMTGGKAKMSAKLGAPFSAWDGFIWGENLELVPGERIVQSWRTTRFTEQDLDSTIAVTLTPFDGGTRLTLKHSNVPDSHTSYEAGGWQSRYFEPMKKYFAKQKPKAKAAKRKPARRKPAKRKLARKTVKKAPKRKTAKRKTARRGKR
jgi:uncharacterized protein YndB with AHSA1/START domain